MSRPTTTELAFAIATLISGLSLASAQTAPEPPADSGTEAKEEESSGGASSSDGSTAGGSTSNGSNAAGSNAVGANGAGGGAGSNGAGGGAGSSGAGSNAAGANGAGGGAGSNGAGVGAGSNAAGTNGASSNSAGSNAAGSNAAGANGAGGGARSNGADSSAAGSNGAGSNAAASTSDGTTADGSTADGTTADGSTADASSAGGSIREATDDESSTEGSTDEGETIEIVDKAPPGARAEVSKEQLERDEYDDLHKVLGHVAGVYIRDEDGYGLRPNIGMRGANADRSQKITLMEDGVLSGPAPYSAPAAYYVPLVTRMTGVEVTKGPSAILYGPATVGGAIDMISQPFPNRTSGFIDLAGGSDLYGKLHAMAAERRETWGLMAEYVHLRTDGFKDLDGGGDTGFDKDDVILTGRLTSKATATNYHVLSLRAQYGRETSNETYTGLTDEDFRAHPQRRYIASQLDQMNWDHWTLRADHRLDLGLHTRIVTTAYRHKFHRAWGKVDGFVGMRDFYGLIAEPNAGANALYYAILTGQTDSSSPEEQLIRGTNDRYFTSQGIQSRFATEQTTGPVAHHVDAGVRFHFDRADRSRYEDGYDMVSGTLVRSDRLRDTVLDTRAETLAVATYAQDTIHYKRLEVSGGLRLELIDYRFEDWLSDASRDGQYAVWIPGGGIEYHITDEASVLAGVHRGFVPVAPSAAEDIQPESSINYEAGARWRDQRVAVDVIGFYSDYSNLKGACTLSSGCMETQEGEEYNGGHVRVWGAEVQAGGEWPLVRRAGLTLPFAVAYTFTRSAFQHSFTSELAGWGDVEKGDELPYLPHHQIAVSAGAKIPRGEVGATVRYRGESRDEAGQGVIENAVLAESLLTLDLSLHARLHPYAELYATCSNVFDEQVIISRRPYGARPNPPRMFAVGYKARF